MNEATILYRQHNSNSLGAVNRRAFGYYLRVLKSILDRTVFSDTKKWVIVREKMAMELYDCFEKERKVNCEFIQDFNVAVRKNKLSRAHFYYKNHLYNTLQHAIWVLICC